MLFIDFRSAFNTKVPSKRIIKLEALGLNPTLCNWVLDFLTGHLQVVKVGNVFNPLILNTGAHKGAFSALSCTPRKVLSSSVYTSRTN